MKKLIISMLMMISFTSMFASGFDYDGGASVKRNVFGIDVGIGKDVQQPFSKAGFMLGMRYQYNVHPLIGIDCIGLNYWGQLTKDDYDNLNTLQALIGVRVRSPYFYKDMFASAGARFGYGYEFTTEAGGFACEVNIAIHLNNYVSMGYVFNHQGLTFEDGSDKLNFHGFKLGLTF